MELPRVDAPRAAGDGADWRVALRACAPELAGLPASPHAAQILASRGCWLAAEALLGELLALHPVDPGILRAAAQAQQALGRVGAARELRRRSLAAEAGRGLPEAERAAAAGFLLAAEGAQPPPARPPPGWVARTFDGYDDYDERMLGRLGYRAPQALLAAIAAVLGPSPPPLRVLDLGCGTGLMGEAIRPLAARLDGVDLSPAMVERARARGVYDQVAVGDLLGGLGTDYDLVVAADVCPYLGDLAPFLAAGAAALAPGGILAFTVEHGDGDGWSLGGARRYAHAPSYVAGLAAAGGWRMRSSEAIALRTEMTVTVDGLVWVLDRQAGA